MTIIPRRDLLRYGAGILAGFALPSTPSASANPPDDALFLHEVKTLEEIDNGSYELLWTNLQGATEEELDWKLHDEANTLRWIVGHLCWFEEWAADAIEETGMYLDDKQGPDSFRERPFSAMEARFETARQRYVDLTRTLAPDDLRRPVRFVYNKAHDTRFEMDLRQVLHIHTTHLAGHRYQVRYIRGTYSRAHETDKSRFDPW